jgi:hypothetical protein
MPGHAVTIVDEAFAPDDTNQDADLAGITVMTDILCMQDAYNRLKQGRLSIKVQAERPVDRGRVP